METTHTGQLQYTVPCRILQYRRLPVPAVLSSARTPAPPLPVFSAQCSPGSPGERRMGAGRAGGRGAQAPGRT